MWEESTVAGVEEGVNAGGSGVARRPPRGREGRRAGGWGPGGLVRNSSRHSKDLGSLVE